MCVLIRPVYCINFLCNIKCRFQELHSRAVAPSGQVLLRIMDRYGCGQPRLRPRMSSLVGHWSLSRFCSSARMKGRNLLTQMIVSCDWLAA